MKANIHPEMKEATVTCACGETFKVKSTKEEINVEVCSKCHPFYTGQQKNTSRAGRAQRFNEKHGFTEEK